MPDDTKSALTAETQGGTAVHVWLFGGLSTLIKDRPAIIDMPKDFTAAQLIAEMGRRFGPDFTNAIMETDEEKIKACKIFMDGLPVEDIHWPLEADGDKAEMEMILLAADEGG